MKQGEDRGLVQRFLGGELDGAKLSLVDARDLILYDVKQGVLNKEKVREFLTKRGAPSGEVERMGYDERSGLKSWLNYRMVANGMGIDCDISPEAQAIIKRIYGVEVIKKHSKPYGRCYAREGCVFESDTMNSVKTMLMIYVRKRVAERYGGEKRIRDLYQEEFRVKSESDFYMFWYLLRRVGKEDDILARDEWGIVKELELLARLTHSVFNFGLVPFWFNTYRGLVYKDFWARSFAASTVNDGSELAGKVIENAKALKQRYNLVLSDEEQEDIRKSLVGYRDLDKAMDEMKGYGCFGRRRYDEFWKDVGKMWKRVESIEYEEIYRVVKGMNDSVIQRGVMVMEGAMGCEIEEKEGIFEAVRG